MNTKIKIILLITALIVTISGTTNNVSAQDDSEAIIFKLEDITVTARKTEENLQDTPIAVTVITGDDLENKQIFSTDLLDQVTPNLQFSNNGNLAGNQSASVIFIRGIGQIDPTSIVDPGVGMYIDDVYMGSSIGGTMPLWDISAAQILRGPQGTLFGKNTIGGAIVLNTIEPGDEFKGTFRVGYGSDRLRDTFLAVDVPLSEQLKSRITFGSRTRDGYVKRLLTGEDLGDTNTYSITGKLGWTPNDRFRGKVQFDYTRTNENGNPFVFAAMNETSVFPRVASNDAGCPGFTDITGDGITDWNSLPAVSMVDNPNCANDFQNKGPYSNNGTFPLESSLTKWGSALHLSYDFNDAFTLKSITAYRELQWRGVIDADNTPMDILETDYRSKGDQFSQEFQLLYSADKLSSVLGLFYFTEKYNDLLDAYFDTPAPGIQIDGEDNTIDNKTWAMFFQGTYDVTEKLAVTLGGRYTEDTKGAIIDNWNYVDISLKYLPVELHEETFTATTLSATASYRWNRSIMTYLSYSEGFKGGGWNTRFNRVQTPEEIAQFLSFGPEEASTVELGFKSDLLNYTLRLNGAIFTTDYDDVQFIYRVGIAPYLANAGKASIDGFELEATYLASLNLFFTAGIGYLDTRVDTLKEIAGTALGVEVGNALPYAPEWQMNVGTGYTVNLSNNWILTPYAEISYNDKTFFDANNTVEIAQMDAAKVLNLSISLEPKIQNWRLSAGVNNATDEVYPTAGISSLDTSSGYAEIAYARPRECFVNFTYKF